MHKVVFLRVMTCVFFLTACKDKKEEISAFNGNSHYTFAGFKGVDESELNVVLIEYIIDNFWNILYPEVHKENTENTWEIYPL